MRVRRGRRATVRNRAGSQQSIGTHLHPYWGPMPEGVCTEELVQGRANSGKWSEAMVEVWWCRNPRGRRDGVGGGGSAEEESWAQGALGAGRGWLGGAVLM